MRQKLESNTHATCRLPKNKQKYLVGKKQDSSKLNFSKMFLKNHKYTKESHTKKFQN